TTTLYAMLSEANTPDTKIITVEDPVEYDIAGIVQVPIHEDIGVTYGAVLRSILRQDPDKILVGEIRDQDTGTTAVEASLTGHTVFATIHTNDAPSTVTRLVDMGIEPFLIAATLECVVAQRLVRSICPHCKTPYEPDEDLELELGDDARFIRGATLYFGKGCEHCHHTGYRGRTGLFEVMPIDEDVRGLIERGAPVEELRQAAVAGGMVTLREAGLAAAAAGKTTVEEVLRETMV
ncbi:MAG: ATPase, T2SS/T4P/T4SS family, partial [Planctomycetota bacterium]